VTTRELYDIFVQFKENDFHALRVRVDRLILMWLAILAGTIGTLVAVLLKK